MKQKDFKKLLVPMASVIAIGVGAFAGLGSQATTEIEGAIVALGTAIATILGAVGVWKNNDKE